jgi:hypothetical protein
MKRFFLAATLALAFGCGQRDFSLSEGRSHVFKGDFTDFILKGEFLSEDGAEATIAFHDDGTGSGYSVLLHGGPIAFRNVYLE